MIGVTNNSVQQINAALIALKGEVKNEVRNEIINNIDNSVIGETYTAGDGIDITNAVISQTTDQLTFTGTQAQWEALTSAEQAKYGLVNRTDNNKGVYKNNNGTLEQIAVGIDDNTTSTSKTWSSSKINAELNKVSELTTEDLNTVSTQGFYYNNASANCTTARHYPCARACLVEVQKYSDVITVQKVRTYGGEGLMSNVFIRSYINGTWSSWSSTDWVVLLEVPAQTISSSGVTISLPPSLITRCRDKRIRIYGTVEFIAQGYGGTSTYSAYRFMNPWYGTVQQIVLHYTFSGSIVTSSKLYVGNSSGSYISSSMPKIVVEGKLGTASNEFQE